MSLPDSYVTLWETLDLSLCEYVCVTMINGDLPFRHGATCPLAPPLLCAAPQEANAIWLNPNLPPIGFPLEFKTNLTLPVARTRAKKINHVIPRVLYNIMANDYVSEDFKDRLRVAARSGRDQQTCLVSFLKRNLEQSWNLVCCRHLSAPPSILGWQILWTNSSRKRIHQSSLQEHPNRC